MRISELHLLTASLAATRAFYAETLGFKLVRETDESVSFKAGSSVLHFHQTGIADPFYHFAFNIPSNQFEEALEWAETRLHIIPVFPGNYTADFSSWKAKAFYFYDNNKNIVEFIARFDLDNGDIKPFDGVSVVSISETGLVVDDALMFSQKLLREYKLDYFSRQKPQQDFVAIGNDNGLFIVVNESRPWYPTSKLSKKYWLKVKVYNSQNIAVLEMQ